MLFRSLVKVTLNVICCRGTLQSRWSTLTDSTSLKAEENVSVTDESRSSWYSSWNGTGDSSDDGGRWRLATGEAFQMEASRRFHDLAAAAGNERSPIWHGSLIFSWSDTPLSDGGGAPALPNFGRSSLHMRHL